MSAWVIWSPMSGGMLSPAGPIPNDGIAVAKSIPQDIVDQITKALIDYCAAAPGAATCASLFNWNGLQKITPDFYNPVRDAAKLAGIDVAAEAAKTPAPPPATPSPSPSKAP